jgi:hypothetical protein
MKERFEEALVVSRGRNLFVCYAALVLVAAACGVQHATPVAVPTPPTTSRPAASPQARGGSSAIATCRSRVAQAQAAGSAIPEWVSLATELRSGEIDGPVIEANDVTDLGQDRAPAQPGLGEPGRLVRFEGVTALRGQVPTDAPLLVSRYELDDARAEVQRGSRLLVRIDGTQHDGRHFVSVVVATRADSSVIFLGDCRPKWTPALAGYCARRGLRPVDVMRSVLLDPGGPTATAFLSSSEAFTAAGP